jgi:hypothetical protein
MTMNAFASAFYRDVTCGAAATLITLALGMAFVQSTSVAPGTRAQSAFTVATHATPTWFGQPEPAVLVD